MARPFLARPLPAAVLLTLLAGCSAHSMSREQIVAQAKTVLKQAYRLQEVHRTVYGAYAGSMRELERVGWEDPVDLTYYRAPEVVRSGEEDLCIVIRPAQGRPDVPTLSMHTHGTIRESADCR